MPTPAEVAPPSRRLWLRWALWWVAATAVPLALLLLRSFAFASPPAEPLAALFLALIVPGHALLLAALPLPVLLAAALLAPGPWVLWLGVALHSLLAFAVLVDGWVFALYRFHLDTPVWNLLTSGVAHQILPLGAATLARAALAWLACSVLLGLAARRLLRLLARRPQLRGAPVAAALLAVVAAGHALHAWADVALYTPITRQMHYLPWLDALTTYRFAERRGWLPRELADARSVPGAESALAYPRSPLRCTPPARPPNLVIVAIEEWRFDELDPVTTPNLSRLAGEAWRFNQHFSSGNASRYGIFGLFYGLHGSYWNAALAEQRGPLLVREARRRGYRMAIHASGSLLHPELDRTVFADLRSELPEPPPGARPYERDRALTDAFVRSLADPREEPFFAFLFYDSPHALDHPPGQRGPFAPALERLDPLELGPGFDPAPLLNRHRNAVHYVDALVGEVLDALDASGLADRTVVVATGDHGEEFDDTGRNFWGHNSNFSRYQTQVPLLLRLPGRERGDVHRLTSHVDVAPTLLREVFGCETRAGDTANGRHLLDPDPRPYVVASGGSSGMAVIEAERLTWIERYRGVRVLDHRLRELPEAPDLGRVRDVLAEMSAFYAR